MRISAAINMEVSANINCTEKAMVYCVCVYR